ncbi:hypothetical protein CVT25_004432 [Psilocybe cyanescens]|uniref:Nephrocystin 3-like N-terminal domain-containing protein n=1 Tax=Psilocybe cyanescens TaxID=93625 RepID=A0A409XMI0_PSICY|nr:hypothetical protein CVT25_004432 [Psilocybe cyanescens]
MSDANSNAPQVQTLSMITANQMIISGGNFNLFASEALAPNEHRKVIYDSFKDYILSNATHDADDPANPWPRCYPNTRTTTLASLESQAQEKDKRSTIIWVSGDPSSGKSAIAGSLCDILQAKGQLGASFFFRPGEYDTKRGFIATIAFHLAISIPSAQSHIAEVLAANPFIFQQSPQIQMEKLVILPLLECKLDSSRVIVVDGLDMYGNITMQGRMLSVLGEAAARLDGMLKIVIFTRPQPNIANPFESELFKPITAFINLNDEPPTREEIRIVLEKEIGQIATLHCLSSDSEEVLVDLSASTAISAHPLVTSAWTVWGTISPQKTELPQDNPPPSSVRSHDG